MNKHKINKTTSAIFVLMLFASLLFINPIVPTILNVNADEDTWLDGWGYRKSHVIIGSSYGNVSDYIFGFKVCKGSGTDGTEFRAYTAFGKVYCNGHCRDDFMDVRFTDSDGISTLPINVMNVTPGDCTYIWVKTSVDAYPANKTIYMYYGNDNATSDSSIAEENFFTELGDGRTLQGNSTLLTNSTGVVPYDRFSWDTPTIATDNSKSVYWYCNVATNFTGRLTVLEGDGTNMTKRGETPIFSVGSGLTRVADIFDSDGYELNMTIGAIMGHYGTGGINAPSVSLYNSKYYPSGHLLVGQTGSFSVENTFDNWTAVVGYRVVVDPEPTHSLWGEEETLETPPVYGAFWLDGWSYRKSHVIANATGAGTNYQVKINVGYGYGTDSGSTVYVNGSCQTDFDDIRFTDYNGSVLLDYWMETKFDSINATFWVEVADDLSSSEALIYMYYGNNSVSYTDVCSDLEHGENTFLFFDNFDDASIDSSKWDTVGTCNESDGSVTVGSAYNEWNYIRSNVTFSRPCKILARLNIEDRSTSLSHVGLVYATNDGGAAPWVGASDLNFHGLSWKYMNPKRVTCATTGLFTIWGNLNYFGNFNVFGVYWDIDETEYTSGTDIVANIEASFSNPVYLFVSDYDANKYTQCDWLFVGKYVDAEPAHGAWGSEESV